jgi:hypothetical protein
MTTIPARRPRCGFHRPTADPFAGNPDIHGRKTFAGRKTDFVHGLENNLRNIRFYLLWARQNRWKCRTSLGFPPLQARRKKFRRKSPSSAACRRLRPEFRHFRWRFKSSGGISWESPEMCRSRRSFRLSRELSGLQLIL